jgi:transcriptional activator of cad operon
MRLLIYLAGYAAEVVSIDDLLNQVWSDVTVSPDSVYQAVASLRRLLLDDPKKPTYIATVPRLGHRMVATVSPWVGRSIEDPCMARAGSSLASGSEYPAPAHPPCAAPGPRLRASFARAAGAGPLSRARRCFGFSLPRQDREQQSARLSRLCGAATEIRRRAAVL